MRFIEKKRAIKVRVRQRPGDAAQHKFYRALAKFAKMQGREAYLSRMQCDLWISARCVLDYRGQQSCGHAFRASEAQLSRRGVREKAEFIHDLLQLVEYVDGMSK